MSSFDGYVGRVFFGTLALILLFAGLFLFMGHKSWSRGIVLGGVASLANLVIMAGDVRRQSLAKEGQTVRPGYGRYALRMTIIAAALVYAATNDKIAFWTILPALFASQFVMICGELLGRRDQGTT